MSDADILSRFGTALRSLIDLTPATLPASDWHRLTLEFRRLDDGTIEVSHAHLTCIEHRFEITRRVEVR